MERVIKIMGVNGSVIFSYKAKANTIKKTLKKAIKENVNLSYADLYSADLRGMKLSGVNFHGANLGCARLDCSDFSYADLSDANLGYANLRGADLHCANLCGSGLTASNLCSANLMEANLKEATLQYSNLCGADLNKADLSDANFNYTNIKEANFKDTIIKDTKFRYAENINYAKQVPEIPLACPVAGSFIGWKKVVYKLRAFIIKLEIPEDAKRCSATTNKCRCDKAKVLEITNILTNKNVKEVINYNYTNCIYRVGEMVYPDSFNENRWNECSHGIHFFINKQDAINY